MTATTTTTAFNPEEFLTSPEAVAEYLQSAFESRDVAVIADALGVAARAKGMSALAEATGLNRQALYRTLSAEGKPELSTVLKVTEALGVKLVPALA